MDVTLDGLEALGAAIVLDEGYTRYCPENGLIGTEYTLRLPAVTGTENLVMAAVLLRGTTILHNAACEPEIGTCVSAQIKWKPKLREWVPQLSLLRELVLTWD